MEKLCSLHCDKFNNLVELCLNEAEKLDNVGKIIRFLIEKTNNWHFDGDGNDVIFRVNELDIAEYFATIEILEKLFPKEDEKANIDWNKVKANYRNNRRNKISAIRKIISDENPALPGPYQMLFN